MDDKSLSHTRYNCTYHIVFIPKYRRKSMYGEVKHEMASILRKLCEMEGISLLSGAVCSDHVHMYVSIPPKMSVSKVMSKLKGKSALMIFDRHPNHRGRYGRHFWARGYYVETVRSVNEDTIKKYIAEQEESDRMGG